MAMAVQRQVSYHDSDFNFDELVPAGKAFEAQLTVPTTPSTTTTTNTDNDNDNNNNNNSKAWEMFHSRHAKGKFFKAKRYLICEFPELLAMDDRDEDTLILDAGCGNGAAIVPFLQATKRLRSVAFDCSAQAVELLKKTVDGTPEGERVEAHVCDMINNALPLVDHSVDAALLIFVLSSVPIERMSLVLNEIHRVLRPGTLLCFRDYGVYDMSHLRSTSAQWLGGRTFHRGDEHTLVTFFDLETIRKLFVQCQFQIEELKYACVEVRNRKTKKSWRRCFVHAKVRTATDEKVSTATVPFTGKQATAAQEIVPAAPIPVASTLTGTFPPSLPSLSSPPIPSSLSSLLPSLPSSPPSMNIQQNDLLFVRPSQIGQIAGDGLYVTQDVSKGSIVCVYTGELYTTHDAMRLEDKSYLMRLGAQTYVDAKNDMNILARYINDCRHALLYNVHFDKRPDDKCAHVVALRDIKAGEELFVDYGWKYWLSIKGKRLPPRIAAGILSLIGVD